MSWMHQIPLQAPELTTNLPFSDYNPNLVDVPLNTHQWDVLRDMREQPNREAHFYSHRNVAVLQQEFQRRGLGVPSPWSLKPWMDRAVNQTLGEYNAAVWMNTEYSDQQYINRLNKFVLDAAWQTAAANKMGHQRYHRDITFREIPDVPTWRQMSGRKRDDLIEHPHYYE